MNNSSVEQDDVFLSFSFESNGVVSEPQMRELATASFVGRGENVVFLGGWGTGKTHLAEVLRRQAKQMGFSTDYLGYPWHTGALTEGLKPELLVVDEFDRWLAADNANFKTMLAHRARLGKSTILISAHSSKEKALALLQEAKLHVVHTGDKNHRDQVPML